MSWLIAHFVHFVCPSFHIHASHLHPTAHHDDRQWPHVSAIPIEVCHTIQYESAISPALKLETTIGKQVTYTTNNMTASGSVVAPSSSTPALLLEENQDAVTHLVVHPLVLLHVLDHHTRRQEAGGRVIGTLLGRRDGNKVSLSFKMLAIDVEPYFSSLVLLGS